MVFLFRFGQYLGVPNQRAEDQRLLPFAAKRKFIDALDRSLPKVGYTNRSAFIRDAIVEKLQAAGVTIPPDLARAPLRVRGPSSLCVPERYPPHADSAGSLNDAKRKP